MFLIPLYHPPGEVEVGFSQAEYRVSEGTELTVPFQIFNADITTWPYHVFVALTVSIVDGTAKCMGTDDMGENCYYL